MLGLESRKKVVEEVVDYPPQSPTFRSDVLPDTMSEARQYASDEPMSQRTSVSESDGLRQCDTVHDSGDYGDFTIFYDAPSPRSRLETHSLTHEDDERDMKPSDLERSSFNRRRELPPTNADSRNKHVTAATAMAKAGGLKKIPRPLPAAPRSSGKAVVGIAVARSVGDVARASRGNNTAVLPRAVKKGRQTPPPCGSQPAWSCWRQESDDVVSEASMQHRRSSAPRSAPALATRSNRTFALRCAAKKCAEVGASPASPSASSAGKPSRSRSAENNARLTLAARSGSGSRPQSHKEKEDATRSTRRPSGDSLTSLSSNLSVATHDGSSYFRRDGGRYSMRVEKSSTTSCLSSAAKRLQVVDKSKPSSGQPRAKQSPVITESKEMTAWKRRKEYDPRKSVAEASARRGHSSRSDKQSSASPDVGQHDAGLGTADEIAKLSNAVAYNLSVLSQSSQSDAVTLVSCICLSTPIMFCLYLCLSLVIWF